MSGLRVQVVDDPARECASLLVATAKAGGGIALAGGSTPRAAYQLAAADPTAWASAVIWFGDERCVAPDDDRSNFRLARETLLDPLAAAGVEPAVHRIRGELGPHAAADAYEVELGGVTERAAPLDLVLLGIGPDGHTLSLFPNQETLSERSRWVVGVDNPGHEPLVPRVSLTFAALESVGRVVFLIAGAEKADAVAAAFGPDARPGTPIPASMVAEFADDVLVLLDPPAAAKL
ncbi:MAG TPA: 6-phosphogluconolactonase [Solirubrobacteraceae bacterium]|nr:6-phosphogluconolactonase [Solirubrobacteraceae bacterium]